MNFFIEDKKSKYSIISNFINTIIKNDIKSGNLKIITRFPPEPNGYLHIGHAKSIFLNFSIAEKYGGICHLRFDDTNPEQENEKYVQSIIETIKWLGFSWKKNNTDYLYFASDYYEQLYDIAVLLIKNNKAYVDSQNINEIKINRGSLISPGKSSPYRNRSIEENLSLFFKMKSGIFNEGQQVLRAKINMNSPNINMRDPIIYRIKFTKHYRTGNKWCIYPMYDYTHCISDAIENITHSLCTIEFEDHKPLYNWFLNELVNIKVFRPPLPKQIEFSRLNVTHTITSKRKLLQLVNKKYVNGWDDPRMPTIIGLKRRGFTPESISMFCSNIGITKSDSWIDIRILENSLRKDLNQKAHRMTAVLNPLKLVIDNFPDGIKEKCSAFINPIYPNIGVRNFYITKNLWIERDDFSENPKKDFFRLFLGNKVRLRYGYIVKCIDVEKDEKGKINSIRCIYFPDSKSGTNGSSKYKVKGNIHWVSIEYAYKAKIRLYDYLFNEKYPDSIESNNFLNYINQNSCKTIDGYLESNANKALPEEKYQFERHGYFVVDYLDSTPMHPIFNRIVSLKNISKNFK